MGVLEAVAADSAGLLFNAQLEGLRGVIASRPIHAGEVLLRLTASQILTSTKARAIVGPFLASIPILMKCDDFVMALALLALIGSRDQIAPGSRIEFERNHAKWLKTADFWHEYIQHLPPLTELCCIPSEWSEHELSMLGDPHMIGQARSRNVDIRQAFHDVSAALRSPGHVSQLSPVGAAISASLGSVLTLASFRWSCACVTSRAFLSGQDEEQAEEGGRGEDDETQGIAESSASPFNIFMAGSELGLPLLPSSPPLALVPVFDMMNHEDKECDRSAEAAGGPGHHDTHATVETTWSRDGLIVRARRAYSTGEAIFNTYGARPGRELLEGYGFILPLHSNASECAVLEVHANNTYGRSASAAVAALRKSCMDEIGPAEGGAEIALEMGAGPMHDLLDPLFRQLQGLQGDQAQEQERCLMHPGPSQDVLMHARLIVLSADDVAQLEREAQTKASRSGLRPMQASGPTLTEDNTPGLIRLGALRATLLHAPLTISSSRFRESAVSCSSELRAASLLLSLMEGACAHMEKALDLSTSRLDGGGAEPEQSVWQAEQNEYQIGAAARALVKRLLAVHCAALAEQQGAEAAIKCAVSGPPLMNREYDPPESAIASARSAWTKSPGALAWTMEGHDEVQAFASRVRAASLYVSNRAACLLGHAAYIASWAMSTLDEGMGMQRGRDTAMGRPMRVTHILRAAANDPVCAHLMPAPETVRKVQHPARSAQAMQARPDLTLPVCGSGFVTAGTSNGALADAVAEQLEDVTWVLECQEPWAGLLVTGGKCIETRGYDIPGGMLGRRVAILQSTPPGGLAVHGLDSGRIVGTLTFAAAREYRDRQAWDEDSSLHCVPPESTTPQQGGFGWDDSTRMYGWVVSAGTARLLPVPIPCPLSEADRVHRSVFRLHSLSALRQAVWTGTHEVGHVNPLGSELHEFGNAQDSSIRSMHLGVLSRQSALDGDTQIRDLTGSHAWQITPAVAQLLCSYPDAIFAGKLVLELGCGVGLLAAVCSGAGLPSIAKAHAALVVIASDAQREVLQLAADNMRGREAGVAAMTLELSWHPALNASAGIGSSCTFEERRVLSALRTSLVLQGKGQDTEDHAKPKFDLILGSELLYLHRHEEGGWGIKEQIKALCGTVSRLLDGDGIFIMAYSPRYRGMGPLVRAGAASAGLRLRPLPRSAILSLAQKASFSFTDARICAIAFSDARLMSFCEQCGAMPSAEADEEEDGAGWDDDAAHAAHPFAALMAAQ